MSEKSWRRGGSEKKFLPPEKKNMNKVAAGQDFGREGRRNKRN